MSADLAAGPGSYLSKIWLPAKGPTLQLSIHKKDTSPPSSRDSPNFARTSVEKTASRSNASSAVPVVATRLVAFATRRPAMRRSRMRRFDRSSVPGRIWPPTSASFPPRSSPWAVESVRQLVGVDVGSPKQDGSMERNVEEIISSQIGVANRPPILLFANSDDSSQPW